ncbi:MAG: hypothetical protein AAGA58_12370 [Verrucomicrobiota bacterium]
MKLILIASFLACFSTANAQFLIDNFQTLDTPNDFASTSIGGGITVEVADNSGGTTPAGNAYSFLGANIGDTFVIRYDWSATLSIIFGDTDLSLETLPLISITGGNWAMTLDNGTGSPVLVPSAATGLPAPIAMDNSTFFQFTFSFLGGATNPTLSVGGPGQTFTIIPEPTTALLGLVALPLALRRRRR